MFNFGFVGEAANTINRALGLAKELVGDEDGNKALEYICIEWLQVREGTPAEATPNLGDADAIIAYAEEKLGVVLTQVDG